MSANGQPPALTEQTLGATLASFGLGGAARGLGRFTVGRVLLNGVSAAIGTAAGMATSVVLAPQLQGLVNSQWKAHPERPLSPADAAAAVERDAMTYGAAEAEAALSGIDGHRFGVLEKLAGIPPNSEQLIQMVRRKVITVERMRQGLIQGNVRSEWADALIQVTEAVPSISQMVHFATRGVYGGSSGLEGSTEDLPGGLLEDAKRNGLKESDTAKYWGAHWRLPSPTQLYVMLHRGLIDASTLSNALRANDYPGFWRGPLAEIAYHVPGRIDLRRMFEHGIIDEARVLKGYKDLGYNDSNAAILTDFAVELAKPKPEGAAVKVDWIARARSSAFADIHLAQKKGNITPGEAASLLGAIGVPDRAASAAASMWQIANYAPPRPAGWKPPPEGPPAGFAFG